MDIFCGGRFQSVYVYLHANTCTNVGRAGSGALWSLDARRTLSKASTGNWHPFDVCGNFDKQKTHSHSQDQRVKRMFLRSGIEFFVLSNLTRLMHIEVHVSWGTAWLLSKK